MDQQQNIEIVVARDDADIAASYPIMKELRTHMTDPEAYHAQIRRQMDDGYNLALLRLDADMYSSTMDALTHLYHRVSPGGYVIVDDYYSWEACRRAVTDFREQHGITTEIRDIDPAAVYWQVPGASS